MKLPLGGRLLAIAAAVKITGALVFLAAHGVSRSIPGSTQHAGFLLLQLFAFSTTGAILLVAHAGDRRTQHLAVALLTIASAFSTSYFRQLGDAVPVLAPFAHLYPDAFLAYALSRFVASFPEPRVGAAGRLARALVGLSLVVGTVLFLVNAVPALAGAAVPAPLHNLMRDSPSLMYWVPIFGLVAVVLGAAFAGGATRSREDRRRVRWFMTSIACCLGPMTISILVAGLPHIGPPFRAWMLDGWRPFFFYGALALLPVSVAYAAAVDRLLPVRVVARLATQHLLARWSVTAMTLVPLGFVVAHIYAHRAATISVVFNDRALALITASLIGGCALVWREPLLRAIDRAFFRDVTLDADRLIDVSERLRLSTRLDELVATLGEGIDQSFRPKRLEVMLRDVSGNDFATYGGSAPRVADSAILITALARAAEPINTGDARHAKLLKWLPEVELAWLRAVDAQVLVPMRTGDGTMVGFLAVGERRSDLPYGPEECRWLGHLADVAGTAMEINAFRSALPNSDTAWRVDVDAADAPAKECASCGIVYPPSTGECAACGVALDAASVPLRLVGKFRMEQRLGRGASGVVYRAVDLALNRRVAIKTLPQLSPAHAHRLHVEAQTMAAVMNPHLAMIFGVETWRGRPMLVCELMEQGTLADRLLNSPLTESEALRLGVALAEGLQALHTRGVLHCDVKPSNVGFTADFKPKLLDFGIAALLSGSTERRAPSGGTPLYMSPEALAGAPPSPMFDLWSLVVLLYEAITGTFPLRGEKGEAATASIRVAGIPRPAEAREARIVRSASFFPTALAADPARRPQSAVELAAMLRALAD